MLTAVRRSSITINLRPGSSFWTDDKEWKFELPGEPMLTVGQIYDCDDAEVHILEKSKHRLRIRVTAPVTTKIESNDSRISRLLKEQD